jgi:hypothetical protein
VVHWLHRDRDLLKIARTSQEETFEDDPDTPTQGMVLRSVAEHLGPQRMEEFQKWAAENHFWCELLAQMASALAQYEKIRGRMFQLVEDVLCRRYESALPRWIGSRGSDRIRGRMGVAMCAP